MNSISRQTALHTTSIPESAHAQYEKEIQEALEKILQSDAFHGGHRSQEFLRHVVELTLKGELDRLKERILGIEIFHRSADYDTSQDAIVRVSANDVRKRLAQFNSESGEGGLSIRLPSGSYIPEFRRAARVESLATPPIEAAQPGPVAPASENLHPASHKGPKEDPPDWVARTAHEAEVTEPFADLEAQRSNSRGRIAVFAAVLALVSLALGAIVGSWLFPDGVRFLGLSTAKSDYSIYRDLLGPMILDSGTPTKIVLSDPNTLRYRGSDKPISSQDTGTAEITLPAPLDKQIGLAADPKWLDFPYHQLELNNGDYTGMGEAKTAFELSTLFHELSHPVQVTEARFLNWDAARTEHLIVLGGPHMSAWMSTLAEANFVIEYEKIRNSKPQPGELAEYPHRRDGPLLDDYGLIWMMQSPSGTRILVLAGITSTGTAGVGAFFANPQSMRPVYERLKAASTGHTIPANWQVLLHIQARDNISVHVDPVAVRVSQ